jgi:peptidyl-prolyl cis-trans isomerase SurA
VLFTVASEPVLSSDFIRVYQKNLELVKDENQKDIDAYLSLFINYKLKVKEARTQGLDKDPQYLAELKSYRKQLAKNYLTDAKASDKLMNEAYQRLRTEVNVDHILIKLPENADDATRDAAYKKLMKLRKRLKKDAIRTLKNELHDGEAMFVESLGFFSAFDMVYAFENKAYTTNVGDVSEPFMTSYGMHILKVNDKRTAAGSRTAAHILVKDKANSAFDSKERITELYNKLNQGEVFEQLAKRYSDDEGSSRNGGLLGEFKRGKSSSKTFENVLFKLDNDGDISKPFETKFGWHVVKLIAKNPVLTYEEMQEELKVKVLKDKRSKRIGEALYADLKKRYDFKLTMGTRDFIISILTQDYFSRRWKAPVSEKMKDVMIEFGSATYTYGDFSSYVMNKQRVGSLPKPIAQLADELIQDYVRLKLYEYHDVHLEEEFVNFAAIMQEYREGILLFNLMENTIWNKSKQDSVALTAYYNEHKAAYKSDVRMNGLIASVNNRKIAGKVRVLLEEGLPLATIKEKINTKDKTHVIFSMGEFEKGSDKLPEAYDFSLGLSEVFKDEKYFVIVRTDEVIAADFRALNDIKGKVINEYQNHLEEQWLKSLEQKYPVKINEIELAKVNKALR